MNNLTTIFMEQNIRALRSTRSQVSCELANTVPHLKNVVLAHTLGHWNIEVQFQGKWLNTLEGRRGRCFGVTP